MYTTLCYVQCTVTLSLYSAQYSTGFVHYTTVCFVHCTLTHFTLLCTLTITLALYSVQYTFLCTYTVHFAVYNVESNCTMCITLVCVQWKIHLALCSVQFHSSSYIVQYTLLFTVYSTRCFVQCTLHFALYVVQ